MITEKLMGGNFATEAALKIVNCSLSASQKLMEQQQMMHGFGLFRLWI